MYICISLEALSLGGSLRRQLSGSPGKTQAIRAPILSSQSFRICRSLSDEPATASRLTREQWLMVRRPKVGNATVSLYQSLGCGFWMCIAGEAVLALFVLYGSEKLSFHTIRLDRIQSPDSTDVKPSACSPPATLRTTGNYQESLRPV